jgi:hypothetical protein
VSEHEQDKLSPELEAAYRAERSRPPMDDAHARRLRLAVAAKLGPPPTPDGGSDPGGGGGAPPTVPSSGAAASSVLTATHLAALVAGLATGVVVGALGHAALVTPPASEGAPPVVETALRQPIPEPVEPAATPEPAPAEPSVVPSPTVDELALQPASAPSPETEDRPVTTLAAERRLVDSARAALSQDRPDPALSAIATHRRRFPEGALAEERDALEVEALAAAGRRDEAAGAAERFARRYPDSLYRGRVRAAVGE